MNERNSDRRYRREAFAAIGLYVATILLSAASIDRLSGSAKIAVALSPTLGAVAMMLALVRYVARMDELQRQTFVVSAAIAALAGALVTTALGQLELAGVPHVSMTYVWPIMALAFIVTFPFVRRRLV